ncbi:GATA transcription factor [Musa troglodytarum]|uniref:GATA transcription factor n=1 Tax=Musa troglodytarum TaxID=320322 RepID=A0A9E7FLY1_9LILI|nr:GATA transcription factor [Musa troglodytarum]
MEAPENCHGGFCRAENPQWAPERKASGGAAGDQFVVEDLLDFSNEEEEEALAGGVAGSSTDSSTVTAVDSCSNSSSGPEPHPSSDFVCRSFADASLSGDLCEPQYEELAELEWLSNFVEESFSSEDLHKLHLISGLNSTASSTTAAAASGRADQVAPLRAEAPVAGKTRSKRSRGAPGSWSSRLLVLSPSLTAASSPESELIVPPGAAAGKKAARKKDPPAAAAAAADGRKCLHCQTDKTPQWRTGPMGPKTLCNACGVRYKSGRLVPEYRPAASPTFVVSKHSNSHRKVLELRRQKELRQQQPQKQLLQAASSGALYHAPTPVAAPNFLIHGPDIRHLI